MHQHAAAGVARGLVAQQHSLSRGRLHARVGGREQLVARAQPRLLLLHLRLVPRLLLLQTRILLLKLRLLLPEPRRVGQKLSVLHA